MCSKKTCQERCPYVRGTDGSDWNIIPPLLYKWRNCHLYSRSKRGWRTLWITHQATSTNTFSRSKTTTVTPSCFTRSGPPHLSGCLMVEYVSSRPYQEEVPSLSNQTLLMACPLTGLKWTSQNTPWNCKTQKWYSGESSWWDRGIAIGSHTGLKNRTWMPWQILLDKLPQCSLLLWSWVDLYQEKKEKSR